MAKKDKKLIRYTDRDFNSIKESLVRYTKRYYPDVYQDFSEASFGSLMLDTVSYVGDVLSFYLDYQANESFLDTAVEYDNILRHGEQVGYKQPLKANSFGIVTLYILVPPIVNGIQPDTDYLPTLVKGSRFSSTNGAVFTLIDDVDFSNVDNEIVVATSDATTGATTSYAIKAHGKVISGEISEQVFTVGEFKRFLTLGLADPNITEVVSIIDAEGNEYFEVDYLSQDTIFRSVVNKDVESSRYAPEKIVAVSVPRRYIVFNRFGQAFIKFGYGSESSLKTDNITHPSNVVLKMHGRDYEKDTSFDPSNLLETDKFGIAPANTTLNVTYRTNKIEDVNVSVNGLIKVDAPIFVFGENATNSSKIESVRSSLEVTNEKPILGDVSVPTSEELRQRINDIFSTQNRAVTADDYEGVAYRMPSKFGRIKRVKVLRDQDSFKRNLNMHLLSEDANGNFINTNDVLKNNLKVWLNNYRMINDTIDILDTRIINLRINFVAVVDYEQDKFEALNVAISEVEQLFERKMDIGEPIYITSIYDVINNLDEIVDVTNVKIENISGGIYSNDTLNIDEYISADGRILYAPENAVYELKFPNLNIVGSIK
tara:strand:+ start:217 stop:2013 length:1797 start_codon:yes stop_codon:yes gene_type:complete